MDASGRVFLLTPPGAGAIAVVRMIGAGVARFMEAHFSRPVVLGRAVHGELKDGADVLDDPVVVGLGEGGVDVNLHGGPWIVSAMLELARRAGFVVEEGRDGVPSLDAVEGNTLLEREVNAHLALAKTELAVRALLAQGKAWEELVARSMPGAGEVKHLARWTARSEAIRRELAGILEDWSLWWLLHPPTVAIIGVPNVGKSTLANRLFARDVAITADLPGTTRDWVGEIANLDGLAVMLVDTPGLRATRDAIEAQAIAGSRGKIQAADLVVVVIDATRPLDEQAEVLEAWPDALRMVNKVDAAGAFDLSLIQGLRTVATTGQGVSELRQEIRTKFGIGPRYDPGQPRWWSQRHRDVLGDAQARVESVGRMTRERGPTT